MTSDEIERLRAELPAPAYADKAAAPLVAEAIFADYVRGRLAALRDHYAAQGRPASEEALLFAAIADCEMAILGPNVGANRAAEGGPVERPVRCLQRENER